MKISFLLAHIDLNEIMRAASKPIRTEVDYIWVPAFNLQEMRMVPMPGTGTLMRAYAYREDRIINPQQVFREMVVRNDDNTTEIIPT